MEAGSGSSKNAQQPASNTNGPTPNPTPARRRNRHRGGRKKKQHKRSYVLPSENMESATMQDADSAAREGFYQGANLSGTSLESEALLDHRDQPHFMRPRRRSTLAPANSLSIPSRSNVANLASRSNASIPRLGTVPAGNESDDDDNENAPLLSQNIQYPSTPTSRGYGGMGADARLNRPFARRNSSMSGHVNGFLGPSQQSESYNVNYPPSMPGTPPMNAVDRMDLNFGDVLLQDHDDLDTTRDSPRRHSSDDVTGQDLSSTLQPNQSFERRKTIALGAEQDICFPQPGMSDLGEEDFRAHGEPVSEHTARSRRRRRKWPDLRVLEEWSRIEEGERSEERRAKKITEPQLVNGRLRPVNKTWFRSEEDAPYRFTYFNDEFESTIHSQTISELIQSGGSFKELFIPDPPVLSDSEESDDEEAQRDGVALHEFAAGIAGVSRAATRQASLATTANMDGKASRVTSPIPGQVTSEPMRQSQISTDETAPVGKSSDDLISPKSTKSPRYGERPTWWLDVYCPTEAEMKVLAKTFGIHPLTAEDIMVQEAREKIELFKHYYFVNYRSFDQDPNSMDFLEPVEMYAVVFREGVLSFHFKQTPHPANVRRRIRQLRDYMQLSADWISYAIIDDITDAFVPLIKNIEDEVDDIDDSILQLHSSAQPVAKEGAKNVNEKGSEHGEGTVIESAGDMLRRVGDCRKKVMMLYRLLGNKADVIKSFSKRCTEQWDVAPRSDIGMYLGDIQDHIVTMTSNLGHYEKILARSHGNYLAQINIRMNERQEQTADVLGKLTVLGTIVLPMNIITGLWGMNVWVPGQEHEGDLKWFWAITGGLLLFGAACYLIARKVYRIV